MILNKYVSLAFAIGPPWLTLAHRTTCAFCDACSLWPPGPCIYAAWSYTWVKGLSGCIGYSGSNNRVPTGTCSWCSPCIKHLDSLNSAFGREPTESWSTKPLPGPLSWNDGAQLCGVAGG